MTTPTSVLPAAFLPHAAALASGIWVIAINAIDAHGRLIEHPTPGLPARLFAAFEYYPVGRPTVFAGETFGLVFEFPTPHGRVSPVHTGHQPALSDDPIFTATLVGRCPNPSLSYQEQQDWSPLTHALLNQFNLHAPTRIWTSDPFLHLTDATGCWTWRRIGHADDTADTWDRPTYRFEHYTPGVPLS